MEMLQGIETLETTSPALLLPFLNDIIAKKTIYKKINMFKIPFLWYIAESIIFLNLYKNN